MSYDIETIQTVYTMKLPEGMIKKLEHYDAEQRKISYDKTSYAQMNQIPGVDITEYYYEHGNELLMFSVEEEYDLNTSIQQIKDILNRIE